MQPPPLKPRPLHLLPEDQFSRQKLETTWSGLFVIDIVVIVVVDTIVDIVVVKTFFCFCCCFC
jgi:hypothetical protein